MSKPLTSNPFFCATIIATRNEIAHKRADARKAEETAAKTAAKAARKSVPAAQARLEAAAAALGYSLADLSPEEIKSL